MPDLITKAWKCSFCSRCFMKKGTAVSHEAACKRNPERRHCATCVYGVMIGDYHDLIGETVALDLERIPYIGPWCAYHKQPMSEKPYYIECDTDDNPYYEEQPIPGTCWNYKYKGRFGWTPESEFNEAVERGEVEVES